MVRRTPGLFVRVRRNGSGKLINWIRMLIPADAGTRRPVRVSRARTAAPVSPAGPLKEPGQDKTSPAMARAAATREGQSIREGYRSDPRRLPP
jgi:hypothetical protein